MKDVPIIFSAPMVAALLDGRKTMTRRIASRKRVVNSSTTELVPSSWRKVEPGDQVWVRETHWRYGRWRKNGRSKKTGVQRWRFEACGTIMYPPVRFDRATIPAPPKTEYGFHKRPAIFLERQFSRLTLVATATKIEPLQEISEADATAEGAESLYGEAFDENNKPTNRRRFELLWRDLNGDAAWDDDPEVVALTFKVHRKNIDEMKEAA